MRQERDVRQATLVFGTVFMEVVARSAQVSALAVPGWTLRAWPVARLGDFTLEAAPNEGRASLSVLLNALRAAGVTPLVREDPTPETGCRRDGPVQAAQGDVRVEDASRVR